MTALALAGWIAAGVLAVVVGWLWCVLEDERSRRDRWRIRAEEADAWAGEHQREATALAGELDHLRQRHATLTQLYADAVRRLLASNYIHIDRNLAWKRRNKQ